MDIRKKPDIIIREPMVEGIFYPANPDDLRSAIQTLLSASSTVAAQSSLIVSPHGSLEFSGRIMASAFKAAAGGTPDRVIIIGSCFHTDGVTVCLPESTLFRTPIADSEVDTNFISAMMETSTLIEQNDLPHLQEHSIEVQLPFIQYLFPQARIVPILVGKSSEMSYKTLRSALGLALTQTENQNLVVVSANLSAVLDRTKAARQAQQMIDFILEGQSADILSEGSRGNLSPENSLALAYVASFSDNSELTVIARDSSLSVHYDPTGVVEYAAIALA